MLFKRRVVQVPQNPPTTVVNNIEPVDRPVIVRQTASRSWAIPLLLLGLTLFGLAMFFALNRQPENETPVVVTNPTTVEKTMRTEPPAVIHTPPPVIQQPPVIIERNVPVPTPPIIVPGTPAEPPPPREPANNSGGQNNSGTNNNNNSGGTGGNNSGTSGGNDGGNAGGA